MNPLDQSAGYLVKEAEEKVVGTVNDIDAGVGVPLAHQRADQAWWGNFITAARNHPRNQ
jgi:hypothetical protein